MPRLMIVIGLMGGVIAHAGGCHSVKGLKDDAGDGGNPSICAQAGGYCEDNKWDMCDPGYEPYLDDQTLDCNGRCCVHAPAGYGCNDQTGMNCIFANSCDELMCWWVPYGPSYDCEPGRVCCTWTCE